MARLETGPGAVVSVVAAGIAAGDVAAPGCWAACRPVADGVEVGPVAGVLAGSVDAEPTGAPLAGEAELAASDGAAVANRPTTTAPVVSAARNERFTWDPPYD